MFPDFLYPPAYGTDGNPGYPCRLSHAVLFVYQVNQPFVKESPE